jgi:hypothetical protein
MTLSGLRPNHRRAAIGAEIPCHRGVRACHTCHIAYTHEFACLPDILDYSP